jgi:ParB/RepB/Spo0J family partition protein
MGGKGHYMEIKFNPEKLIVVEVKDVRPNTWNPKDSDTKEYQVVKESLEKKGFRLPIVVRENNGYEIIDGEQRWTAWKELGNDKVLIYNEGKVSDQEARELTIWYEQRVPFNEIDLAQLVKEMSVNYENLELPFSDEEMQEMIQVATFNWDDYKKEYVEEEEIKTITVRCDSQQYDTIMEAIEAVKGSADNQATEADALTIIASSYLENSN